MHFETNRQILLQETANIPFAARILPMKKGQLNNI